MQQNQIKKIDGYSIYLSKVLGKGSYASVYVGKQETDGELVAVKILSKDNIEKDEYLKAAVKNQIDILQKLHSENVVGFYDVMESSKNYYIIQQLCDGDLSADIKPGVLHSEVDAVEMLRQICNGFLTLVREGIIHRDLKPANIMKKGKILKLGDFGFARQMNNRTMVSTCVGTPLYMSLQILKAESYTSKCDIWALGFIFYEILHGIPPWTANRQIELIKNIERIPLTIKRKDLSPETQNFLCSCLQLKQVDRISWDEIFRHPIFNGYFDTKANESQQFQNKLKMIMNKLRFYVSQKNLDMKKIMNSMGFGLQKEEVNYQDFYHFFKRVHPDISQQETYYVFKKTDTDGSGSISVDELKNMLLQNGIKLDSQFAQVPSFLKDEVQTFRKISADTSGKIKSCFEKLYKIITKNNLTLWKVFNDFDKKKGSLNLEEFASLLRKLCSRSVEISEEEIRSGFDIIDQDGSNSIQFDELDKYYSKINGILPTGNKIYEPMQIEGETNHKVKNQNKEKGRRSPHKETNKMQSEQMRGEYTNEPQQQFYQQHYQPNYQQPPEYYPQNNMNYNMNFSNGNNNVPNGNISSLSQGGFIPSDHHNNFNQVNYQTSFPPQMMFTNQNQPNYGYNQNDNINFQGHGHVPFQFSNQGDATIWNLIGKKL